MSKAPSFFKENPERGLALLLGVVILSLGVVFIALAWTEPSGTPPTGNVAAPINVSDTAQVKMGKLGVKTDGGYDPNYALSVGGSGASDGLKVSGKLDMDGNDVTGVNKITVNTVDPIYKIGEKKYATYMIDFVGLNAEVAGESKLKNGKKVFNLANRPQGSDLWLFWNIVKKDSIKPFVTAQGPADLYAKVKDNKLIIKSIEGKDVPFSYRLIGTRLDYNKESNLYSDQDIKNYINTNTVGK